jgi:hypothetical protein
LTHFASSSFRIGIVDTRRPCDRADSEAGTAFAVPSCRNTQKQHEAIAWLVSAEPTFRRVDDPYYELMPVSRIVWRISDHVVAPERQRPMLRELGGAL